MRGGQGNKKASDGDERALSPSIPGTATGSHAGALRRLSCLLKAVCPKRLASKLSGTRPHGAKEREPCGQLPALGIVTQRAETRWRGSGGNRVSGWK